jgi:hypothetical protein
MRTALPALLGLAVACHSGDSPAGPTPPVPPGAVFASDWSTALGSDTSAVKDGGRWTDWWEFGGGDLISVVPEGIGGRNALRVVQRGGGTAASLQVDDFLPQSSDFYVRFYLRNDDTSRTGEDIATVDTYGSHNLVYIREASSQVGWNFMVALSGCAVYYPVGHWTPVPDQAPDGDGVPQLLAHGEWYRFEFFVHYTSPDHIQIHPRVYDPSGTLLYSDADFKQNDYGNVSWNGRSDWTLESYYAAGHDLCVVPKYMNDLMLGNPGQLGAVNTGLPWYFAGVVIRNDGWPGP